ncbi:MAG TPA: trypsin-like peptidase domain-containing protein [Candidatus Staskawiczbacteria bacterium]|nr:trypsin-like peptidase domain-containing protein [Candidatus Staskawiczbacteria bacterium]
MIISKNLPTYEQKWVNPFGDGSYFDIQIPQYVQNGTEYKEVGSGSGFIVSADGLVLTNKHVVIDKDADYSVVMNDGQKYSAEVLATDPVQDLAIIKIKEADGKTFVPLVLGNSDGIQLGQTAIAIGNALGEFSNTVSVGIVSGLSRTISASDELGTNTETLEDIIQTDAAINSGNSGGPLMNLKGEVIGINTAIAQDAQNIAFAIPINYAKKDIDQVKTTNKISYPFLGIRYVLVDENVKKAYELSVDYGAYISSGAGKVEPITKDSPAEKAGLKEGDVILEMGGEKITATNTLAKIMQKYSVGDSVTLKILRGEEEFEVQVQLAERQDRI